MKWLLDFLERKGRYEVLVDAYSGVHWRRYYLFYYETPDFDWLPNVYIHIFPTNRPDGEDSHSHPWNTMGWVLRGGYKELINDTVERVVKRFRFSPLSHKSRHRLVDVIPGTVTLFFHGFKKQPWKFFVKPHDDLCDYCRDNNEGVCIKPNAVLDFAQYLNRAETDPSVPFSKRRSIKWTLMTPDLKKRIERRVEALKRLGLTIPQTKEEKYGIMREIMVSRKQSTKEKS